MRLFSSLTSPYVRKVRLVAVEKDISLDLIPTVPFENDPDFLSVNPIGTIPALVTKEGKIYDDSNVICAYLDYLKPHPPLYPSDPFLKLDRLQVESLANGVMAAAVKLVYERRRPAGTTWDVWINRQKEAIRRTIMGMERYVHQFDGDAIYIDQLAWGCALGYIDYRFSDLPPWRKMAPKLADWYEHFSHRPSMLATQPQE